MTPGPQWKSQFDARQLKEIAFAIVYDTDEFRHGTNGHNDLLIISKLANLLTACEQENTDLKARLGEKGADA